MSVTQATTIDRAPIPAGITRPETYINGKAVYGGVNDPRMGTTDREPCKTCGCSTNVVGQRNRVNECPGHFGHIEVGDHPCTKEVGDWSAVVMLLRLPHHITCLTAKVMYWVRQKRPAFLYHMRHPGGT
jgi:hypothetical protein